MSSPEPAALVPGTLIVDALRKDGHDVDYIESRTYMGAFPRVPAGNATWRRIPTPENPVHLAQHGIHVLVLCAEELQPDASAYPGVEIVRVPLEDDYTNWPRQSTVQLVKDTVARLHRLWLDDARILVTCAQGRNRSGLVTGLLLNARGMSGKAAVQHIRRHRKSGDGEVLGNPLFAAWVANGR